MPSPTTTNQSQSQSQREAMSASILTTIHREMAQRAAIAAAQQAPPRLPNTPTVAIFANHCKYYSTGGYCGKGEKCRFVHDPNERMRHVTDDERCGRNPQSEAEVGYGRVPKL